MTIKFPEHLRGAQAEFHKKLKEKRMTKITVIIKKPGEDAYVAEVDKGLKSMQAIVGGSIELMAGDVVGLPRAVDVWFNEEGKLESLPPNLKLVCNGELFDILVGPAFFTCHNNQGDTLSLDEAFHDQVLKFTKEFEWRGGR